MPADPSVGEGEGGRLTTREVPGMPTEVGSRCFVKTDRTSREQRRLCNTREQCHRWQLLYRSTDTKDRPFMGEGLPTVGGCLSEPREERVKANSNNPKEQARQA